MFHGNFLLFPVYVLAEVRFKNAALVSFLETTRSA